MTTYFSFKEQNQGITTQKLTFPACFVFVCVCVCVKRCRLTMLCMRARLLFSFGPNWSVSTIWNKCRHATNVYVLREYDQFEGIWGCILHPIMINHWRPPPNLILFNFLKSVRTTCQMWDLRLSERCCWGFRPSGMWHYAVVWVVPGISKGHSMTIFKGQAVHSSLTAWVQEYLYSEGAE
jgi:hypothetical protein